MRNLSEKTAAPPQRVFGLDVMRAAAILIVVDAHATIALKEYYTGGFWHHILPDGVELFFVLSGFLIGGILIRTYEKKQTFDGRILLNFWTRRWFRTLPNYYLVLVGLIGLALFRAWRSGMHHTLPSKGVLATYFLFLQNFVRPIPDFFPETWSLSIEEWSYLTLPVVLWGFHSLLGKRWTRQRIVLLSVLTVIVFTNLLRLLIAIRVPLSEGELGFRGIVLVRLDAISYGVLTAYVKHYYPAFWQHPVWKKRLLRLGLVLTMLVAFSASIHILKYYVQAGIYPAYTFYKRTIYFPLIGLCMTLIMPYIDGWRQPGGIWTRIGIARAITHISLISYSMYLLNLTPIMITLIEKYPTTSATIGWLKVLAFWGLTIGLSTLLYRYFEKPVTEMRERLSAKEPTLLAEPSAPEHVFRKP